jgi:hypothetical protein
VEIENPSACVKRQTVNSEYSDSAVLIVIQKELVLSGVVWCENQELCDD